MVEDWKSAWRWFSMWALGALAALPAVWVSLPAEVQAWLPPEYRVAVMIAIALGGLAGRLVSQTKEGA